MALIAASGTIGEWQNWILFRHGGNFGIKDPQFHKDIGFYIFKLPFMNFVVDWTLAILIVTLIVSVVFHYLNGGILPQRGIPRAAPGGQGPPVGARWRSSRWTRRPGTCCSVGAW